MIIGAHSIIYSTNPDADRALLRDVLGFPHVDVGGGWLIFGLPPSEVAVHPSDKNDVHALYLMCDDIQAFIDEMKKQNVVCGLVQNQGWGLVTRVTLPGGGVLGVYEPRHARPKAMPVKKVKGVKNAKRARNVKRVRKATRGGKVTRATKARAR